MKIKIILSILIVALIVSISGYDIYSRLHRFDEGQSNNTFIIQRDTKVVAVLETKWPRSVFTKFETHGLKPPTVYDARFPDCTISVSKTNLSNNPKYGE